MKKYAFLKDKGKGNYGAENPISKDNVFIISQEERLSKYVNDAGFLTAIDVPQTVEQLTVASAVETTPLTYYATATNFPAGNKFYAATPKTVTLDTGDATFGRVDLILANRPDVVGGMGYITVSKGTPALNYAPNNIDLATQYIIRWIYVAPNATVGDDVSPKPSRTYLSEFINDGNGDITKPFITIDDIPIPKVVENEYANMIALYAGQIGQTDTFIQFVTDASAHSEVTSGSAYFEYLGTTLGNEADYRKLSSTEVASVASSQADWNQTNTSSPDYIKNKLAGEIRLPAYPSTRNDGVIPTNKVLSTDASGNLKLYSIATAPAPFIDTVVPDSTLPSTTGNFQLHGSFFTPSMCLTANLATSIIFTGQSVNYAIFHSSNWIEVNITTGATEGSFAITLNNGLSATFANAFMIVLGTVFIPTLSDWTVISGVSDRSIDGKYKVLTKDSQGMSDVFLIPININFRLTFKNDLSPLEASPSMISDFIIFTFYDTVTGLNTFNYRRAISSETNSNHSIYYNSTYKTSVNAPYSTSAKDIISFQRVANVMYFYVNGILKHTYSETSPNQMKCRFIVKEIDFIDIKYIELAV
jgi:hypothetical protein